MSSHSVPYIKKLHSRWDRFFQSEEGKRTPSWRVGCVGVQRCVTVHTAVRRRHTAQCVVRSSMACSPLLMNSKGFNYSPLNTLSRLSVMSPAVCSWHHSLSIYLKDTELESLNTELKVDSSCHPVFYRSAPFEFIDAATFIKVSWQCCLLSS